MKKIQTNEISGEAKASLRKRVITALILVAICVPCLFLGKWFFLALVMAVSGLAAYELVNVIGLKGKYRTLVYVTSIIFMLMLTFWTYIYRFVVNLSTSPVPLTLKDLESIVFSASSEGVFFNIAVSSTVLLVGSGVYFFISLIDEDFTIPKASYLIAMNVIVSLCLQSMLYLRYIPASEFEVLSFAHSSDGAFLNYCWSAFLFVYVVLGTICCDIGAYFVGMIFGRHKLNERISPKKTWEGFVGGLVFSFAISATFAFVCAACKTPIHPNLQLENWYWIVILSIGIPLFANLGDFSFSNIKRHFGIKDFSNVLPGHGGILDRIDSLLFTSAFVAVMLIFISKGFVIFE